MVSGTMVTIRRNCGWGMKKCTKLLQSFGNKVVTLPIEGDAFNGNRGSIESYNFTMGNEAALYRLDWNTSRAYGLSDVNATLIAAYWGRHRDYAFRTLDKKMKADIVRGVA